MADQVYPDIPEPDADPGTVLRVVVALKQTLETIVGKRGPTGWGNQTFFQRTVPKASKVGDKWILPAALAGEFDIMSVWDGTRWRRLTFS